MRRRRDPPLDSRSLPMAHPEEPSGQEGCTHEQRRPHDTRTPGTTAHRGTSRACVVRGSRPATLPPLRRGGRPPWQSVARCSGRTKEALRPVDHHSALGFACQGTPWRGGPVAQMSRSTIPNPQCETSLCQCLNQTEGWDGHRKTIS